MLLWGYAAARQNGIPVSFFLFNRFTHANTVCLTFLIMMTAVAAADHNPPAVEKSDPLTVAMEYRNETSPDQRGDGIRLVATENVVYLMLSHMALWR
jgi:hypothetical protein